MITRFAPSPTGPLHLGHAYSALIAHDRASAVGGTFLLRIEDIDRSRARPEWEALIFEDLHWLGLRWPVPVIRQSDRLATYQSAVDRLTAMGLTYPCTCSRADIRAALSAPQEGAESHGPDGRIYPGTCRGRQDVPANAAIRLDIARAIAALAPVEDLSFLETGPIFPGPHVLDAGDLVEGIGDIVLSRPGIGTSYHLAVTLDDAAQGVTEVTRGADLFDATKIHRLLQALLELPTPSYYHHDLIRDANGKRLAKRDDARALRKYREDGATPTEIRRLVGL